MKWIWRVLHTLQLSLSMDHNDVDGGAAANDEHRKYSLSLQLSLVCVSTKQLTLFEARISVCVSKLITFDSCEMSNRRSTRNVCVCVRCTYECPSPFTTICNWTISIKTVLIVWYRLVYNWYCCLLPCHRRHCRRWSTSKKEKLFDDGQNWMSGWMNRNEIVFCSRTICDLQLEIIYFFLFSFCLRGREQQLLWHHDSQFLLSLLLIYSTTEFNLHRRK